MEVSTRIQATHSLHQKEDTACPTDLYPPVNQDRERLIIVATATTTQPQTPNLAAESDAGEPDGGNETAGGVQ